MPITVNGIGTHYYGRSNEQSRSGVCSGCGAQSRLSSYDTRLWFVFLFIPVIPLGRKRIIDQCGRCRRHMVAKLSDFEMSKQLGISGAMAHYREQPSPEAALAVHGALIAFQQWEEAHKFRDLALEEHKESAVLHAGLATQLMQRGRLDDAVPLFEKALELRSDLPEARTGVARIRMAQGKLEEARELLGFLELPGAGQLYPLEALELLAQAYQRAGRHAETIALAKHIIDELPPVGQVYAFRKFVARSEKALRSGTTVLPKRVRTMRGLFDPRHGPFAKWERLLALGTIVVVTIAVTAAALNTFWQQRRVVYLVSESGTPYEVTIDGQPFPQTGRLTRVRLAEGKHRVKIAGPTLEEFDMNMATNYVERWTRDPIWVVNVDGGMALLNATLRYSANPKATQGRVLMGGPWFYFPHVDYAFSPPPQTVNIGQGSGEATKVYVDCAPQAAQQLFQYALQSCPLPAAFRFGEARLRKDHQDALLLDAYVEAAKEKGQTDRAREFLKAGLDGRPVAIVWHRAYQDVCTATGRTAAVAAQYDALLAKEPDSAALLYLRGRVDGDHIKGQMFFDRACQADPRLGWPWMALAYDAATMGDWPRGRQLADKAFELKLDCPSLQVLRHLARLATGDTAAMKTEYHDRLQAGSPEKNVPVLIDLCEVLAVRGETAEARQAVAAWKVRLPAALQSGDMVFLCEQVVSYLLGELRAIQDRETGPTWRDGPEFRLHVLTAAGQPQAVAEDAASRTALEQPWNALALSVAFDLAGSAADARRWRDQTCAVFDRQDADLRRAAAALRGDKAPTMLQLKAIAVPPNFKALLVAALARRFPEQKTELLPLARKLNVSRLPPYQLVQKAGESL